jgi:hypothetical protein
MAMVALASFAARPACGAPLAGPPPLPVVTQVMQPGDILGTADRPGPTFMIAASGLTVVQQTALNLGAVLAPTAGTATLTVTAASNAQTYTGPLALAGFSPSRAVYAISGGTAGRTYTVALPSAQTLAGFTTQFNSYYSVAGASASGGTLDATGGDTLYVGGAVTIPNTAASGVYTGDPVGSVAVTSNKTGSAAMTGVTWQVVKPLTLARTADLAFGDIIAGPTAGTVVVSTAGARSATGGVTLGRSTGVSAGQFTLNGEPAASYNLTVSPSPITLTSSAGNTMTVTPVTTSLASSGSLPATLPVALQLGGTLNVGANQPAGNYTGTFTLTVGYQ